MLILRSYLTKLIKKKPLVQDYKITDIKVARISHLTSDFIVKIWLKDILYKDKKTTFLISITTDEIAWFKSIERTLHGNNVMKVYEIIEEFERKSKKARKFLTRHINEYDIEHSYEQAETELLQKYS